MFTMAHTLHQVMWAAALSRVVKVDYVRALLNQDKAVRVWTHPSLTCPGDLYDGAPPLLPPPALLPPPGWPVFGPFILFAALQQVRGLLKGQPLLQHRIYGHAV